MEEIIIIIGIVAFIAKLIKSSSEKTQNNASKTQTSSVDALKTKPVPLHAFGSAQEERASTSETTADRRTLNRTEIDQLKNVLKDRIMHNSRPKAEYKPIQPQTLHQEGTSTSMMGGSSLHDGISASYEFGRQRVGSSGSIQGMGGYTEGESTDRCIIPHDDPAPEQADVRAPTPLFSGRDDLVRAVVLSEVLGSPVSRRYKQMNGRQPQPWQNH